MKLHAGVLSVEARRDEGGGCRVEREAWSDSVGLLGGRRVGRVAG